MELTDTTFVMITFIFRERRHVKYDISKSTCASTRGSVDDH